jgi:CubicO group peptidase (beta-lactamase class C family)
MAPTQHDLEAGRPAISTLAFIDPQDDPGRRHVTIRASRPRPLPRELRRLTAQIPGAGCMRDLDAWVTETHTTALLVLDGELGSGVVVHEWYADGVSAESLFLGASMTKSVLPHMVGRAVRSGDLRLEDTVAQHVPELAGSGYAECTIENVLTMTTGVAWVEDHRDPDGPATRLISCFAGEGGDSRALLTQVGPRHPPGSRWEYNTADSQVLDWVRERATGTTYAEAATELWATLGCVHDAVVGIDAEGVPLAGGGLAACAEDWLRLAALQLTGTAYGETVLDPEWVRSSSTPPQPWLEPGRLPSSITTHAGFGYHWWPLDAQGVRVTSDGSRGQFGYVDHELGVAVLKTSLWPYDDFLVDRQHRDLAYLGLPLVAAAARTPGNNPGNTTEVAP